MTENETKKSDHTKIAEALEAAGYEVFKIEKERTDSFTNEPANKRIVPNGYIQILIKEKDKDLSDN